MKFYNFYASALLILTSCSGEKESKVNANDSLILEAESYVRSIAKDPDSVTFRNVQVFYGSEYESAPGIVVCGEFNGRNGFGGYGGYEKFGFQSRRNDGSIFFISDSMIGNGNGNFDLFIRNKLCLNSEKIFK